LAAITEEFTHLGATLPIAMLGIVIPVLNTFSQNIYSNDKTFDEFIVASTQKRVWIFCLSSGPLLLIMTYIGYNLVELLQTPIPLTIAKRTVFYILFSISIFVLSYPLLMVLIRMLKDAI